MSRIINLSEASSLAIHAMVLVSKSDIPINAPTMAKATGASKNHLAKVMQRLAKTGYVKSIRGPSGGFVLSCDPQEINLLNIFESIEGPIEEPSCPLHRPVCPFDKCLMNGIVKKLSNEFKNHLKKKKLFSFV